MAEGFARPTDGVDTVKDYDIRTFEAPALAQLAAQLMEVVARREDLYLLYTKREEMEPKLRHTRSIYLTKPRQVDFSQVKKTGDTADVLECEPTGIYRIFQPAIDGVLDVLRDQCGVTQIGRAFITKLLAGERIDPHIDEGAYFRHYHRFHLPLFTAPDCLFTVGESSANMERGVLYAINNCRLHAVDNRSTIDRVHLIVDAR